jgi:hypothetical protein
MSDDEAKSSSDEGASTASVRECHKMNEGCFVGSNPSLGIRPRLGESPTPRTKPVFSPRTDFRIEARRTRASNHFSKTDSGRGSSQSHGQLIPID